MLLLRVKIQMIPLNCMTELQSFAILDVPVEGELYQRRQNKTKLKDNST